MTAIDPLVDTLFRSTAPTPAIASAAPVRETGTRSRAGNAMTRTRRALLDGAHRAVETSGTRITMAQVAAAAGVAKATLYNHFRTREAVLAALVVAEVEGVIADCEGRPLREALARAATDISRHPLARALARLEPAALAAVATQDRTAEGWRLAREAVETLLAHHQVGGADLVLRWLGSFVLSPAGERAVDADLDLVLAALPPLTTGPTPGVSPA